MCCQTVPVRKCNVLCDSVILPSYYLCLYYCIWSPLGWGSEDVTSEAKPQRPWNVLPCHILGWPRMEKVSCHVMNHSCSPVERSMYWVTETSCLLQYTLASSKSGPSWESIPKQSFRLLQSWWICQHSIRADSELAQQTQAAFLQVLDPQKEIFMVVQHTLLYVNLLCNNRVKERLVGISLLTVNYLLLIDSGRGGVIAFSYIVSRDATKSQRIVVIVVIYYS